MSNEIKNITPSDESFSDYLATIYCENPDDFYSEKCKLCNSPFRKEAQEKLMAGTSVRQIHIWLKEQKEDISYVAVSDHLYHHYLKLLQDYNIKKGVEAIEKWGSKTQSDEEMFVRYINGMDKQVMRLIAANEDPTTSLQEARKNTELVTKLTASIADLKTQLVKLDATRDPARIILSTLGKIIAQKVSANPNDEVKKLLRSIMDQLQDETKHLLEE